MKPIVTDYAARRLTSYGDAFTGDDPEKYLRFQSFLGGGLDVLDAAGVVAHEYYSNFDQDGEFRISTTIRYTPSDAAFTAFKNLSGGADFVGSFQEFAQKLTEYATLWQDAIYQLDVYPDEPYLSKARIDYSDYYYYDWSGTKQYPAFSYSKMKPALEDVIRWACEDREFERLHAYVEWTGIDTMVEALREGVPVEDILA